jgi:hypothetical protein
MINKQRHSRAKICHSRASGNLEKDNTISRSPLAGEDGPNELAFFLA